MQFTFLLASDSFNVSGIFLVILLGRKQIRWSSTMTFFSLIIIICYFHVIWIMVSFEMHFFLEWPSYISTAVEENVRNMLLPHNFELVLLVVITSVLKQM